MPIGLPMVTARVVAAPGLPVHVPEAAMPSRILRIM